ncbi:MAG TPA: NADH-quinone oxidoreductase subunit H [Verrucomicrobiota bacterium]|nr:NADH-quinone oxidoreductase subunit H [Verrucomicrobiota bacterium]HNU49993.1 NADH-quinone oxidoreductase subunit H [Verrucomicrobiota bacterium]
MNLLWTILGSALNVAAVVLLAPLAEGVLRKITARIQSRQGPPLLQPYYDLLKLLGKEDLESGECPRVQRFAACLAPTAILAVATFLPMGFAAPMHAHGDVILLVYLLTLVGISTLLAGLAAGSAYSLLGISREMMTMITLEPLFAVALIAGAVHTRSFHLDTVLHGSVYATPGVPWSGFLLLGVFLLALPAFVQRVPFDVAEAETEIMEGALMEYSGPKLALIKFAQMAKLVTYCGLFVALFAPWGSHLVFPVGWLVFWLKVFLLVLLVTFVAATHARYRVDQAIRYFALLLGAACVALVLASLGH